MERRLEVDCGVLIYITCSFRRAGNIYSLEIQTARTRTGSDQVLWGKRLILRSNTAGQCLSLFRRCVKPYVYAVFLWLPCESITPHGSICTLWINKLLQESLMRMCDLCIQYYSDDEIRVTRAVCYPSRTKWSILWPLAWPSGFIIVDNN